VNCNLTLYARKDIFGRTFNIFPDHFEISKLKSQKTSNTQISKPNHFEIPKPKSQKTNNIQISKPNHFEISKLKSQKTNNTQISKPNRKTF